jgi:hypothetical protein
MVHAYNEQTGAELWNSSQTSYSAAATYAAPTVAQGRVYAGSWSNFSGGGRVGAFSLNSTAQILSVTPSNLTFTALVGGSNPATQSINVANAGSGTLNFTALSDSNWLTASPGSGTAPQNVLVGVNIASLTQGTYTGHITVSASGAQGSPATVTVTLTVSSQPILSITPGSLTFNANLGGTNPTSQSLNVTNTGAGSLNFTVGSDSTWLSATPTSGTAPAIVQANVNISGLAAGTYKGNVTVTASGAQGSPASIPVTLTISSSPPPGTVFFGDQAIESQSDTNNIGTAEAFQTTANVTGTFTTIGLYLDSTSTITNVVVGLYTDSNGHPGSLLTQGSTSQLTKGTWNNVAVSAAQVSSGTKYWIAVLGRTSGTIKFRDRAKGPCFSEINAQSGLSALPSIWSSGSRYTDCPLSAYGQ